ncbi:MAG: 16S rRNA (guanine(527)-N(7))-methyltransferase RsmG [Acutalibacteraceae bacterium]
MEDFINKTLLAETAEKFRVKLDETALERFNIYARQLVTWNEKINLTAIIQPDEIVIKHFIDSLSLLSVVDIPKNSSLIDVGTGAGFPGIAVLIARPDIKLTLLDSTAKKLNVIANILSALELEAQLVHSRAEEAGRKTQYRENFDFASARAVANLRELCEYCLPFVRIGGTFIAMKGAKADEEADRAKKTIKVLGAKIESKKQFELENAGERNIFVINKISHTPTAYPRPSAKIAKMPLV